MKKSKKVYGKPKSKIIGREYTIGEKTYLIYKERLKFGQHIYVMLEGEMVYSSKKNKFSVSIFLKSEKKNNIIIIK